MESRYQDDAVRALDRVDQLVQVSRWVGAETSLAVWGGGNTSVKLTEPDILGRPVRVLRVKGSGSDLKSVTRRDFPGVRLAEVLALLERDDMGDQEMVDYLARCLQEPGSPRPSIETLLHGFLDAEAVIHTHADAIVGLTNTERGREVVKDLFGKETVWVAYRRPGLPAVAGSLGGHPGAAGGAGDRPREARAQHVGRDAQGRVPRDDRPGDAGRGAPPRRRAGAAALRPADSWPRRTRRPGSGWPARSPPSCAGCSDATGGSCSASTTATTSASSPAPRRPRLARVGPATPDHTIYSKRLPCYVPLGDPARRRRCRRDSRRRSTAFVQEYTAYFEAHRHGELMKTGGDASRRR